VLIPFRHEARHDPKAGADLLRSGLEQDGAVGGFEGFGKEDCGFVDTGAGLGVKPSIGTPKSPISLISAAKNSRFALARNSE
jgi:hypothetical protein